MYEYGRKKSKLTGFLGIALLVISVAVVSIFLYDMYLSIDVESYEHSGETVRLARRSKTR